MQEGYEEVVPLVVHVPSSSTEGTLMVGFPKNTKNIHKIEEKRSEKKRILNNEEKRCRRENEESCKLER